MMTVRLEAHHASSGLQAAKSDYSVLLWSYKQERENRVLAVCDFVAFIDDSGNSPADPWFVLAAWVSTAQEWEYFTEDWNAALKAPPSIDYFKHHDAIALKKCFAGFSEADADDKCLELLKVILRHHVYGVVSVVSHQVHRDVVQGGIFRVKNRLHRNFTHAFYLSFHDILSAVIQIHSDCNFDGKIDFVSDGGEGSGPTNRCIQVYEFVKNKFKSEGHPYYPLMGSVFTGDDKEIKPLQASDFLAGQMRIEKVYGRRPTLLRMMSKEKLIVYHEMTADLLKAVYVDPMNQKFLERF